MPSKSNFWKLFSPGAGLSAIATAISIADWHSNFKMLLVSSMIAIGFAIMTAAGFSWLKTKKVDPMLKRVEAGIAAILIVSLLAFGISWAAQKKPESISNGSLVIDRHVEQKTTGDNSPIYYGSVTNNSTTVISEGKKKENSPDFIVPGNERRPKINCPDLDDTSFVVTIGNNVFYKPKRYPYPALMADNDSIVTIKMTGGKYTISAKFFGRDGRIIAKVIDNRIVVNNNNIEEFERPNNHSITVFDQYDNRALELRFLNRNTLDISGVFFTKSGRFMEIGKAGINSGTGLLSGNCVGRSFVGAKFGGEGD